MNTFSLVTDQGTAASETCHCDNCTAYRDTIQVPDDCIPDSWTNTTENEVCTCIICGYDPNE